jgi:hypothetical protein
MIRDTIVDEVRAIREAIAAEHGHDLKAIVEALRRQEREHGVTTLSFPPRRIPTGQTTVRKAG